MALISRNHTRKVSECKAEKSSGTIGVGAGTSPRSVQVQLTRDMA